MLRLPTHVQLEVTDKCNLRCRHCYRLDTEQMPKSNDLSDSKIYTLVKLLIKAKIYSLVITGGEPLTRPEVTVNAAKIAKEAGMFVSINTNLLLLTPEIIVSLKNISINSMLVSCPSSDQDIYRQITKCGNYSKFISKLRLLVDSGISCMINMVVTPINHSQIRSTATEMSKFGVKRFAATPASLNVEYPDDGELLSPEQTLGLLEDLKWCSDNLGLEVDVLEPMPKCFYPKWAWEKNYAFTKRICQAGRMSVSISNTGEVRPCSHNPVSYGNLYEKSLENIWSEMASYRSGSIPNNCHSCPSVLSCNGACRTNSLAMFSSLSEPDRLMVGHMDMPLKKPDEITFNQDSIIYFKGKLRWRREGDDYSISSKSNAGNLVVVNEAMFNFVSWLSEVSSSTVKEILNRASNSSAQDSFNKIINFLVKREFIYIE